MKLTLDKYASYLEILPWTTDFQPLSTSEIAPGVIADYSIDGQLVGLEFLKNIEIEYTKEAENDNT
jgi:hypothetical protein